MFNLTGADYVLKVRASYSVEVGKGHYRGTYNVVCPN